MLKFRITYSDEKELGKALEKLETGFDVLSISKPYRARGKSQYSNVYLDMENKDDISEGKIKITKAILDKKIKEFEPEATHDLTFREWIRELENEFEIEHADLDNMTDYELNKYDEALFEISLK